MHLIALKIVFKIIQSCFLKFSESHQREIFISTKKKIINMYRIKNVYYGQCIFWLFLKSDFYAFLDLNL